jgi:formate hydrogenlyase subunit 4
MASAAALYVTYVAGLAEPALAEMQERIGGRLATSSMRIVRLQARVRQRLTGVAIMFGLATAFEISALVYAVTR